MSARAREAAQIWARLLKLSPESHGRRPQPKLQHCRPRENRRPFAQLGFSQSFAFTPRALPKPWLPSCTPTGQVFTGPRKSIFLFTVFRIVVYPTRMSPDFSSCDLQRRDPEGQVAASWFSPPLLAVFAGAVCSRGRTAVQRRKHEINTKRQRKFKSDLANLNTCFKACDI